MMAENLYHRTSEERPKPSLQLIEPRAFARLTNPEWRREVLERVDQLIDQIVQNQVEVLVFLDKSARPLSWLLRDRLQYKKPGVKLPKIQYIDLGLREEKEGVLGDETIVEKITKEADVRYLKTDEAMRSEYTNDNGGDWKSLFFARGDDAEGEIWMSRKHVSPLWQDTVKQHPELIEQLRARYGDTQGKTLIIDDLLFSGRTLKTAVAAFAEAYPHSDIYGVHFFNQESKSPETQIPWFKKQHMIGVEEDDRNALTTKKFSGQESQKPDVSQELRNIIRDIAQSNN